MWKSRNGKSKSAKITEIPTIVVECPRGSQLPYVDEVDHDEEEDGDPEPLSAYTELKRTSLRRNSISFPSELNTAELDALRQQYVGEDNNKLSDVGLSNSASDIEDDLEINKDSAKIPLRNARKKSVINPEMLKPHDDDLLDTPGSTSPGNSITSINSLASLLKEKMQGLPSVLRKKKPNKEYKIKAFVGVLFLVIVFLVGLAYVLYHQQVLQRAYFQKIKFNKAKRVMRIFDTDGTEIIRAKLGTTMNYDTVYPCLAEDLRDDGSICLEWMNRARLYLNFHQMHSEVRCYNVHWISLSHDVAPTDCFEWLIGKGHWYGGGQTIDSKWPLEKSSFPFSAFVTGKIGKHKWGNVLKRYFINSRGASITVDKEVPLYISLEGDEKEKSFCLQAKHDSFAYVNHITPLPHLNYSLCTSSNMTILHSYMSEKSLWDGLKQADIDIINSLLSEPLWEITTWNKDDLTEGTIYNYTEDVIALGFLKQGHVLVNEFWQDQIGDFTLDTERFPTLQDTVDVLHRRGFRIVLSIQPFISTESVNFAECVRKRLLVSERFSDRRIPALTRYKSLLSAGVLDVTNNKTIPWLQEQLKNVQNTYKIDAFYLDLGIAYNMPHYYQCEKPLINPDKYKTVLINSLQGSTSLVGVSSAVELPRAPIFVSLPQFESSWESLQTVIPTILTYGVIGYPFLIPGAVGGDVEPIDTMMPSGGVDIGLPNKELYVRWLQLSTFLPVIKFTYLPSKYGDEKVLEMAKILTVLRQKMVTPLLKKYARESLDSGLPLIRPLWMLEPSDPACHSVVDEFAVGEELIVAPVLYPNVKEREVYLPAGVWKDGIDGSLRKGSRWIHDYRVGEDQVAYFLKMPDNTRF